MALLYSANKAEVLRLLNIANRSERFWHSRNAELRREAEEKHREASIWLDAHKVPYTYDKTHGCYIEEASDAE